MPLFSTLIFILNHPLGRLNRRKTLERWLKWQVVSRLSVGAIEVPFVNNSKLFVRRGMTGATGNIYCGLHEFEEMAFLLHLLRPEDTFLDIGANVGTYSILSGAVVGAATISIEPVPSTWRYLVRNIKMNDRESNINARNIGISDKDGFLRFTSDFDTVNYALPENDITTPFINVEVTTLDKVAADKKPVLIKMDVEGFEQKVVAGGETTLKSDSLFSIIAEINGSGYRYGFDDDMLMSTLISLEFEPYRYLPFERKLLLITKETRKSENVIFIKKKRFKTVAMRLMESPPFYVLDYKI